MADYFGSNLARNPFPLSSLYIPLLAFWPVLGDWNYLKPNFCLNPLVFGEVVYPLGVFLGNGFVVGDGRVWFTGGNFSSLANKCGRHSLRNKEISPKITLASCLA